MADTSYLEPSSPSFCDSLLGDCRESWQALHDHPFIRELAAGTLAPDRFRFYVEQDLFFLPELARAVAIGIAHADDTEEMRHFAEETAIVVGRELENQHELLRRIGELGALDRGGSLCAAPATLAYGSFLVATAHRGGSLDVMAALLPCTWSYADIAVALEHEIASHPVYGEWVGFFANPDYVEVIAGRRRTLDRLAQRIGDERRRRLSEIFTTSTRLERRFWDMAYRLRAVARHRGGGMKAALLYDGELRVEETADPAADGWALVSTRAAGVCGTELHFLDGMIPPPTTPFQLGHEAAGIVLEAPAGSPVAAGDRVAVYNMVGCGRCPQCRRSRESLCTDPVGQLGFSLPGGFADVVRAPAENLVPLPDSVSFETAALLACSGMSVVHASRLAGVALGDTVVVNGVGGVGLMAIQVANAAGARTIAIADSEAKAARGPGGRRGRDHRPPRRRGLRGRARNGSAI